MPAQPQRGREFLDGERDPVRAAGHRAHQLRPWLGPQQRGEDDSHAGVGERGEVDFREAPDTAQLRPDRAQPVISRQFVAAVAADQAHRAAAEGVGQRREQVQRRLVRPLQVVEEQDQAAAGRGGRY